MWVATAALAQLNRGGDVSIHATRVGGDDEEYQRLVLEAKVSIHATRVGGDA